MIIEAEQERLRTYQARFHPEGGAPLLNGKAVLLVDDGLATGSTMRAAVAAARLQQPARVVVAVPVAALSTYEEFQAEMDEIVCVFTPEPFHAVGLWYETFSQTTDEEIQELLARAAEEQGAAAPH